MNSRGLMTRRNVVSGVLALAAAGVFISRKSDLGGAHGEYFQKLTRALRRARIAQPVIVIDRTRLRQNASAAARVLADKRLPLRVVVKSLPAPQLIDDVAAALQTQRYMVFNGVMLLETAKRGTQIDALLGKPLPVEAARQFYDAMSAARIDYSEPQWLIDAPERLQQYAQLARERDRPMRINLEIDVGLHRGGAASADELLALVRGAQAEPKLVVSGLMGYDAHVPRMPNVESAWRASQAHYATALEAMRSVYGESVARLTLNSAGSPTYRMHAQGTAANEVSVGSAFVKPADFDLDTLTHHAPAAFIATPVIKALNCAQIPGLESLTGLRRFMNPNTERAFFIYGGHWLARPESPPGLEFSSLYGRSSNQELLMGSSAVHLRVDDYVFFRPMQSEALLLQFGDLLVYENGEISQRWPTYGVSA
ncbi:MAG TPA: alanine racemase [Steroidobacter sp.]|nr:alanine racemase [Steroidobacter sp.]